jgi:AraC family transcriptional regulator
MRREDAQTMPAVILRGLPGNVLAGAPSDATLEAICRRHSCIVLARARHAECAPAARPLMLAAARGGRESYTLDRRRISVDDDNFLVLNAGRVQATAIHSETDVECFKIFFRAGMAEEALAALMMPADRLLDREPPWAACGFEFCESLRPHDRLVSPVWRYIRQRALTGDDDVTWFDEQLSYLLERLLLAHREVARKVAAIPCARSGTRKEIYRRVSLAVDYIESCYEQPIELETLAQVACLSKFHFLRAFRSLHGVTPQLYLQRKRAGVAKRMLATTDLPTAEIALRVGYASRTSLTKQVRQWTGSAPSEIRRHAASSSDSSAPQFRHNPDADFARE